MAVSGKWWLLTAICCIAATQAAGQTKVESNLELKLREDALVKVIVVTRPDPDQPGGGAAIASPASYISARLGASARNVKALGRLPIVTGEIDGQALALLRADPNVALVTEDVPVPPTLYDTVKLVGADRLHAADIDGSNYSVAVLDTGIDATHPAFSNSVVSEACFSTPDSAVYRVRTLCPNGLDTSLLPGAANGCPHDVDGCDHGTHVAGIVAGHDMAFQTHRFGGMAPAAQVVPIQVFTLFDDEEPCRGQPPCVLSFTSDQIRALEWVYKRRDDYKIAAVNMSLGGGYADKYCDTTSALTDIIERLKAKGVLTVIAAGNSAFYDGVSEPACISAAISVSAMNKDGALDVSYSNVSPLVDIAAPGTAVVSSVFDGGYSPFTGTSMAAPHVAASIALLREEHPNASGYEIESMLKASGQTVSDPRTGTKIVKLQLSAPSASAVSGTVSLPSSGPSAIASGAGLGETGSFIIRTPKSEEQLRSTLEQNCPEVDCSIKGIGPNQYVIELSPKVDLDPTAREELRLDKDVLKEKLGGDVEVFDNKAFAPMTMF